MQLPVHENYSVCEKELHTKSCKLMWVPLPFTTLIFIGNFVNIFTNIIFTFSSKQWSSVVSRLQNIFHPSLLSVRTPGEE